MDLCGGVDRILNENIANVDRFDFSSTLSLFSARECGRLTNLQPWSVEGALTYSKKQSGNRYWFSPPIPIFQR